MALKQITIGSGGGGGTSKGYSAGRTWSHSIGKVGGGSFYSGGIAAGADWRNQYSAKVANLMGIPWENKGVGGAQLSTINNSAPNFATIFQNTPGGTATNPPYLARPGANLIHFHLANNDLGFAYVPLNAFKETWRSVVARLVSNLTIEDNDAAVTAAVGNTTSGTSGTTRTATQDRSSGLTLRKLATGQVITISGQPLGANFPGGEAWIRFTVETGDVNSASIVIDGGAPVTFNLNHVNGTAKINNRQDLVFGGTITGGTFTLSFGGQTTGAITWSGTAATLRANIETALAALSNVGATGSIPSSTGTAAAPGGQAVRVKSSSTTAFDVTFDTPILGAAGTSARLTANTAALTGTTPTLTIKEQAGTVAYRTTLAPGAHTIQITASSSIVAQPVQFDCIDILTTGIVPPTIIFPSLHRMVAQGNTTFFQGYASDANTATWNTALQALVAEFTSINPRMVYVDYDTLIGGNTTYLGTGAGGVAGDGVHPFENGLRLIAKAIYDATPTLTTAEAVALGNNVQDDWYDLVLGANWTAQGNLSLLGNMPPPQFRKDAEGKVFLRGLVKAVAAGNSTAISNLPPGYRPLYIHPWSGTATDTSGTTPVVMFGSVYCGPVGISTITTQAGAIQVLSGMTLANQCIALDNIQPFFAEE